MKSLIEDLKKQEFKNVYLLFGEETYLKNQYKNKLKNALIPDGDTMNLNIYSGKGIDVKEVIDQAETMPFFGERRLILIEDSGFFKNASPELADYMKAVPAETFIVFAESEVDKRGKLYKAVKSAGRTVEFARQDEKTLMRWILGILKNEKKNITQDTMQLFLEKTGTDMENISQELEKLICYTMGRDVITKDDVEAIGTNRTVNKIFDMINAIAGRQQKKALSLYYDLLALKEPPMRILFLIARQFNLLFQVKELLEQGYDINTIASKTGLQSFIARNYVRQAGAFTKEKLKAAVQDCVDSEEAVKTGQMIDRMSVELIIVKYSAE